MISKCLESTIEALLICYYFMSYYDEDVALECLAEADVSWDRYPRREAAKDTCHCWSPRVCR